MPLNKTRDNQSNGDRAERIREIVDDYLQQRAHGNAISDESILTGHPELMPELAEQLRYVELFRAAQIDAEEYDSAKDDATRRSRSSQTSANAEYRGVHIRCPHC